MQVRYTEPFSRAWQRMVQLLFRPFDPAAWLVFAFAAWLAGLGSSSASSVVGSNVDVGDIIHNSAVGTATAWEGSFERVWALPLIALAALIAVALAVLVLWLSSRAKLVWVEAVVTGRAAVVEPWTRLGRLGDSLFLWRLAFTLIVIVCAVVVAGVIIGPAALVDASDMLAGLSFAAMFTGIVAATVLGVGAAVINLLLDAFVVPIMLRYRLPATDAWRALLPWIGTYPGHFVLFVVAALVLAILFTLAYGLVVLVTCCIASLPYIGTLLLLPLWMTWRLFSLEFMAQFDPGLDVFQRS